MIKARILLVAAGFWLSIMAGCGGGSDQSANDRSGATQRQQEELEPAPFNADSAYAYIQKQVDFGPRVPNTAAHRRTASWLTQTLQRFADTTSVQKGEVTAYNGKTLYIRNIKAVFNPEASKQVLLCAHWDTRPFADRDTVRQDEPIPGANDGGSGTGVLLEIARQLSRNDPGIGVKIVLFDAEDYGAPESQQKTGSSNKFCLGSRYWGKRINENRYFADYGILLDMVGAENATFMREGFSLQKAPQVVDKVWGTASQLGHTDYFSFQKTKPVMDDHVNVIREAGIPTANIIDYSSRRENGFGAYWHTHGDNMDIISRNTLRAVGETVLTTLYKEGEPVKADK